MYVGLARLPELALVSARELSHGMTEDEAQRSPSTLLRAVSLSNGRWIFYEVVKFSSKSLRHL